MAERDDQGRRMNEHTDSLSALRVLERLAQHGAITIDTAEGARRGGAPNHYTITYIQYPDAYADRPQRTACAHADNLSEALATLIGYIAA